jgi:hypothetical protein
MNDICMYLRVVVGMLFFNNLAVCACVWLAGLRVSLVMYSFLYL